MLKRFFVRQKLSLSILNYKERKFQVFEENEMKESRNYNIFGLFSGTFLKSKMSKEGYVVLFSRYQCVDQSISENLKEMKDVNEILKYL